jgi:hypothetical protein
MDVGGVRESYDVDREGGFETFSTDETDLLLSSPLDSETQERLLVRKLDLRILPLLCLLYLFACEFLQPLLSQSRKTSSSLILYLDRS